MQNVTEQHNGVKNERKSLSVMIARKTIRGCVILGIIALILGMYFNTISCGRQYISLACNTAKQAAINVEHGADAVSLANRVMEIYRSLSEEDRQKVGTDEYRAFFGEISSV